MLQSILSFIYFIAESIDKKFGWYEEFNYETQPYCGFHHCGHNGKLTSSHYHEGEGGKELGNKFLTMYLTSGRDDKWAFVSTVWSNFKHWITGWNVAKSMEYGVLIYHNTSPYGRRAHGNKFRGWIVSLKKFESSSDGQMVRFFRVHKQLNRS